MTPSIVIRIVPAYNCRLVVHPPSPSFHRVGTREKSMQITIADDSEPTARVALAGKLDIAA
jgi:hypothetical protein